MIKTFLLNNVLIFAGTYYLGPKNQPLQVYCNMNTGETCLRGGKTPERNHIIGKYGFWLTETGINVKKALYNVSYELT